MIPHQILVNFSTTPVVDSSVTGEATFYAPPLSITGVPVPSQSLANSENTSPTSNFSLSVILMLSVGLLAVVVAVPGFVVALRSLSRRNSARAPDKRRREKKGT
ncbi:hypothetical protein HD806DRAFT_538912 [Xylariaceae sp. AK1471]|nr:hypothetical protein HD806DRAFT_538912 [Xylariaceae sp. AK1471]